MTETAVHSAPSDVICTDVSGSACEYQESHHCPVYFLQSWVTPKREVNGGNKRSRDKQNDPDVIKLISQLIDPWAVV
jgi:hypothetical protein